VEATDDREYIKRKMAPLIEQIYDYEPVVTRTRTEMLTTEGADDAEWVLVVDVRSATNLPLNGRTDHGLPTSRV
jgi:hypothetical protein